MFIVGYLCWIWLYVTAQIRIESCKDWKSKKWWHRFSFFHMAECLHWNWTNTKELTRANRCFLYWM